jgi:molybdenum cofactor cytidylyltransferase
VTRAPHRKVAVVLAAGAGTRYRASTHKLLAPFRGTTVVGSALEHARAAGLDATWVVTGAVDLTGAGVIPAGVEVLVNDRWAEGQATSLQVAVAAARADPTIGSLVVGLGDQPLISRAAWRAVAGSHGRPIAAASYRGRRRNPVRIDRQCWPLLPTTGDEGARVLMRQHPELVMEVPIHDQVDHDDQDDEGDPIDIDTAADLAEAGGGDTPPSL